jgi:Uma2 family endonuclease
VSWSYQGDERAIYQRANVLWYWIVDPTNRSLQVYRLTTDGYLLDTSVGDRGLARGPFEAVELEALFPPEG